MKRIDFISFDEFQQIYKVCKDKEMKIILLLGFGSGLRISEIVGLHDEMSSCCNKDINRVMKEYLGKRLKKMICSACEKELTVKDIKRNRDSWKIPPLTPKMIDIKGHKINLEVAKGGKWRTTITAPALTQKMVDCLPIKTPRRTIQYRFDQLTKRTLDKKMSIHILRHGFGNYQANILKLPISIVQQMMGHSRLDTTGIYTKANPEQSIKTAWEAMGGK